MEDLIMSTLTKLEEVHRIKVIFACEAGSRAAGLHTSLSDFDVRFIYIKPIDWYLSIDSKNDVLSFPINNKLDIHGWDLRKALYLMKKSNPTLLEWLSSSVVYLEDPMIVAELRRIIPWMYSRKTCFFHYLNMTKRN